MTISSNMLRSRFPTQLKLSSLAETIPTSVLRTLGTKFVSSAAVHLQHRQLYHIFLPFHFLQPAASFHTQKTNPVVPECAEEQLKHSMLPRKSPGNLGLRRVAETVATHMQEARAPTIKPVPMRATPLQPRQQQNNNSNKLRTITTCLRAWIAM